MYSAFDHRHQTGVRVVCGESEVDADGSQENVTRTGRNTYPDDGGGYSFCM